MTDVGVRSIYIYVNNTYLRPMKKRKHLPGIDVQAPGSSGQRIKCS